MDNALVLHNTLPAVNNYQAYKTYVSNIPVLEEQEERKLLEDYHNHGNLKSAQLLIMSQLKTVLYVSRQYKNYGLPEEDLVQEGNIGLMKAVKNFNISHKVRLYSYALLWIKAEMQSYILKNWKIVKIGTTKNLKKLFFNFRAIQKEMIDLGVSKQQLNEFVAQKLEVNLDEVQEVSQYFGAEDISISLDPVDEDSPVLQLRDDRTPETMVIEQIDGNKREKLLSHVIEKLTPRQQEVIKWRFFKEDKKTHKELAKILNVSSERIRQIEQESMQKMRTILRNDYKIEEAF